MHPERQPETAVHRICFACKQPYLVRKRSSSHPVPPPLQSGKSLFPHHRGSSEDRIAHKKSYKADAFCFFHGFFQFFDVCRFPAVTPARRGKCCSLSSIRSTSADADHRGITYISYIILNLCIPILHLFSQLYKQIIPIQQMIQKTPPASCHGNRGRCGFMGNASGAAKPQCSRELTHARAAVLAWSLLYIFRVVLYTFWLMALLALVAAACLASSVSAAATAAFISA